MILCLYVEVKDEQDRNNVASILKAGQYPVYDATDVEPILFRQKTLEEIECEYEGK